LSNFQTFRSHTQGILYFQDKQEQNLSKFSLTFQRTITRTRVSTEELEWIVMWILNNAPIKSGTEKTRVLQFQTIKQAYENYSKETQEKTHFKVRSESFILKMIHYLNVRLPNFNRYLCPICSSDDEVTFLSNKFLTTF
jgi:hypothetical protein